MDEMLARGISSMSIAITFLDPVLVAILCESSGCVDGYNSVPDGNCLRLRAAALDFRRHFGIADVVRRRKTVFVKQEVWCGDLLASHRRNNRIDPMRLDDSREGVARTRSRNPDSLL